MYALIVVIGFECWSFVREALRYDQVDFGVYRHGGTAMLHGADLYALRVGTLRLPFTYPPAAALLFAPFAWLAIRPECKVQTSRMGSNQFRTDIPNYLEFYRQGRLDLDGMISRRGRLSDINDAFRAMKAGEVARTVLMFD